MYFEPVTHSPPQTYTNICLPLPLSSQHDPTETDLFQVIVNGEEYRKWKAGDKTIPLTEVVDAFEVFHTGQGAQGILGKPSKQQLDTIFGTHNDTAVVEQILEKGELQSATAKDRYGSTNDSKNFNNQVSSGAVGGGR